MEVERSLPQNAQKNMERGYTDFICNKSKKVPDPNVGYMVRLTILSLLLVPSTNPLLRSLATAFSTALISFSRPLTKLV